MKKRTFWIIAFIVALPIIFISFYAGNFMAIPYLIALSSLFLLQHYFELTTFVFFLVIVTLIMIKYRKKMKTKLFWILALLIGLFFLSSYLFFNMYDQPKTEEIQQCCFEVEKKLIENEEKKQSDEITNSEFPSAFPYDRTVDFCKCVGGEITHVQIWDSSTPYCKTGLIKQNPSRYYSNKCG